MIHLPQCGFKWWECCSILNCTMHLKGQIHSLKHFTLLWFVMNHYSLVCWWLPVSLFHPFIHLLVIFSNSKNAFQQPSAVLKLLQRLLCLSLQWQIFPPCGCKTKTSFGSEGSTQNLMFTINVDDYFVLPYFHCGYWYHIVFVWSLIHENKRDAPSKAC